MTDCVGVGLKAIGKTAFDLLRDDEIEKMLFYNEYYTGCNFAGLLEDSVGAAPFLEESLSEFWKASCYLDCYDLALVMSNIQAHVGKSHGLKMLTLGVLEMDDMDCRISELREMHGILYESLNEYSVPVYIPIHESNHFRGILIVPGVHRVFVFDFLRVRSLRLAGLLRDLSQMGYEVEYIGNERIQMDGWSCGLWCIWSNVLCHTFFLSALDRDVFEQWATKEAMSWSHIGHKLKADLLTSLLERISVAYKHKHDVYTVVASLFMGIALCESEALHDCGPGLASNVAPRRLSPNAISTEEGSELSFMYNLGGEVKEDGEGCDLAFMYELGCNSKEPCELFGTVSNGIEGQQGANLPSAQSHIKVKEEENNLTCTLNLQAYGSVHLQSSKVAEPGDNKVLPNNKAKDEDIEFMSRSRDLRSGKVLSESQQKGTKLTPLKTCLARFVSEASMNVRKIEFPVVLKFVRHQFDSHEFSDSQIRNAWDRLYRNDAPKEDTKVNAYSGEGMKENKFVCSYSVVDKKHNLQVGGQSNQYNSAEGKHVSQKASGMKALKHCFEEMIDEYSDHLELRIFAYVRNHVRREFGADQFSDNQIRNAWYRMFGNRFGKECLKRSEMKQQVSKACGKNKLNNVVTENKVSTSDTQKVQTQSCETRFKELELKQNEALIDGSQSLLKTNRIRVNEGRESEYVKSKLEKAGFMKGVSEYVGLAAKFLSIDEYWKVERNRPQAYFRDLVWNWKNSKKTGKEVGCDLYDLTVCIEEKDLEGITPGAALRVQQEFAIKLYELLEHQKPSLPDIFKQVSRYCDTGSVTDLGLD